MSDRALHDMLQGGEPPWLKTGQTAEQWLAEQIMQQIRLAGDVAGEQSHACATKPCASEQERAEAVEGIRTWSALARAAATLAVAILNRDPDAEPWRSIYVVPEDDRWARLLFRDGREELAWWCAESGGESEETWHTTDLRTFEPDDPVAWRPVPAEQEEALWGAYQKAIRKYMGCEDAA